MRKYLSMDYSSAIKHQNNNIQSIIEEKKPNFNFWLSNSITAAAAVLITFSALISLI